MIHIIIILLNLISSVCGSCPKDGHFLGHCSQCLYSAQCPKDHFCCPYMKKCVRTGHDPCYSPIANCRPTCSERSAGYPDSCTCAASDFPNNWVTCENEVNVKAKVDNQGAAEDCGEGKSGKKRKLQLAALTTFEPIDTCIPEGVTLVASDVYPAEEGEIVCSNAEECALNGVETVEGCAEILKGKDCNRFYASRCLNDISIDLCVCAGGQASIPQEGSYMYEIGEKTTPSQKSPRELCEENKCNVVGGCLFQEEVDFSCETDGYNLQTECEDRDAGIWCDPFTPKPDCGIGVLPLSDTSGCTSDHYTCTSKDGPNCCENRRKETRPCIPCDQTAMKKPENSAYTTKGSCEYELIKIRSTSTPAVKPPKGPPSIKGTTTRAPTDCKSISIMDNTNTCGALADELGDLCEYDYGAPGGPCSCMCKHTFASAGKGKCVTAIGEDPKYEFLGRIGFPACRLKCYMRPHECYGFSVSIYRNCLLWLQADIRPGGDEWGNADCMLRDDVVIDDIIPVEESTKTPTLSYRGLGESCGYVFGIGEVGKCAEGLLCACVDACANPMIADAPSTCIQAFELVATVEGCSIETGNFEEYKVESIDECREKCDAFGDCEVFSYFDRPDWLMNCFLRDLSNPIAVLKDIRAYSEGRPDVICVCDGSCKNPNPAPEPSKLPTIATTSTLSPTKLITSQSPEPAKLFCPKGTTVVEFRGFSYGADIAGCGLSKCLDRFSFRSKSIKKCKAACKFHPDCHSFSYAPRNGDQYWVGKRVCTLYKGVIANRLWPAVDGTYQQLLCKLDERENHLKCPKHTHHVSFMGQYAGTDIDGCGLQKCHDRFGKQSKSIDECHQACRANSKCRSFTFAPVSGDKNWPKKSVCTLYAHTIPNKLWPNVDGDYSQIMCVIKHRAHRIKKHVSCERKAQLGMIMKTNDPEECAAEILSDPSKCSTGTFMLQEHYSFSWGCRCCANTGWMPHQYWSMYKVDMKKQPLMLQSAHQDGEDVDALTTAETNNEMTYNIAAAIIGLTIGLSLVSLYSRCRQNGKYGGIQLDSTRLNDEIVA